MTRKLPRLLTKKFLRRWSQRKQLRRARPLLLTCCKLTTSLPHNRLFGKIVLKHFSRAAPTRVVSGYFYSNNMQQKNWTLRFKDEEYNAWYVTEATTAREILAFLSKKDCTFGLDTETQGAPGFATMVPTLLFVLTGVNSEQFRYLTGRTRLYLIVTLFCLSAVLSFWPFWELNDLLLITLYLTFSFSCGLALDALTLAALL